MKFKIRFPIRYKILLTLLVVVTAVVSTITFTMANLFHSDKRSYIHDLTSLIALHSAKEADSLLSGYHERLQVFARLMYNESLQQTQKTDLLKGLFKDFDEFVAVTLYDPKSGTVSVYDVNQLTPIGLSRSMFDDYRQMHPLPLEKIRTGEIYIENSTLSEKLPTLTLAIPYQGTTGSETGVVTGTIRLDRLLSLAGRSKVFETFLLDGQGTILAHTDITKVVDRLPVDWLPDIEAFNNQQSAGTTQEYDYNGVGFVGGFSQVEFGSLLVGVQIEKNAAFLSTKALINDLLWVAFGLLLVSSILGLLWAYRLTQPIQRLSYAAKLVSKGDFDVQIESTSRDEIGSLATSFNHMTTELKNREHALIEANEKLVQSEKLSAFGQLSAGIAHEVKNPLTGILGYAQLSLRKLDKDTPLHKNISVIEKEAKRCKAIIENLMRFARQEQVEFQATDLIDVAGDALAIVDHQLSINRIKVIKQFDPELPLISGNANQIQQVLINLMINAQQAMEGSPGTIALRIRNCNDKWVEVWLKDNGPGIDKSIQDKLFEPFFTTKKSGKGTGLGLSVSYGIIKEHNGKILIHSTPGKGTTFVIVLPISNASSHDDEENSNERLPDNNTKKLKLVTTK